MSNQPQFVDLTGQTFGQWKVLGRANPPNIYQGYAAWRVQCACGAIRDVSGNPLRAGRSKSCGCAPRRLRSERYAAERAARAA